MKILQLTAHFRPNIGGVETHYNDLVKALTKRSHKVFVLTYRPLTTKADWNFFETRKNFKILRLPWIPGLFYKLVSHPLLEFLYLFPGLFLFLPFVLLFEKPDVIHAHGLVAGAVAVFWKKIFGIRVVVSTHSIYHFSKKSLYRSFSKWMFTNTDYSLGLSTQAANEIRKLGIDEKKVDNFTYWIDLENFQKVKNAKKKLGWEKTLTVLFVGRLVGEKGLKELIQAAKKWNKHIKLEIVGFGPLEKYIQNQTRMLSNVDFIGRVSQKDLPLYYSAADLLIVPSVHEEGFGRVILESLACGTPVIGSNRGAIPEAMDETVGKLIDVTPENVKKAVEFFYNNQRQLKRLSGAARKFAVGRYSEKNVEKIISRYTNRLDKLLHNTADMALKRRARHIIEKLNPQNGDKILDVGCGDGYYLHLLSNLGLKLVLTGADFDSTALSSAKKNLKDKNVKLVKADLMKRLPFKTGSFDKVIMSEVVEHLPYDKKGLEEVSRVLIPKGILCLTVPNANYPFFWDPVNWLLEHFIGIHIKSGFWAGIWNQHMRLYTPDQITKVLKKSGFKIEICKTLTRFCVPFNHYLLNLAARKVYGGSVSKKTIQSISKFKASSQKPALFDYSFKILNLVDRLNDFYLSKEVGVSVFVKAVRA